MKIDITSHPDNAKIAEMMVEVMRTPTIDVKPTRHAIAEAGKEFGEVTNWIIGDELNLVEVKDNSTTTCQITEWEPDMLLEFLIDEGIEGNDRFLHLANILGIEHVSNSKEFNIDLKDEDNVLISITRTFYNSDWSVKSLTSYFMDKNGNPIEMLYRDALDWMLRQNRSSLVLQHGEVGRPRYVVVKKF